MTKITIIMFMLIFPSFALAQNASFLGPQSSSSPSNAASTETLNILQPATPSQLQSADSSEGGIGQPEGLQTLQQTQAGDQVKILLEGETEKSNELPPVEEDDENKPPYWILGVPLVLGFTLWLRQQSRFR